MKCRGLKRRAVYGADPAAEGTEPERIDEDSRLIPDICIRTPGLWVGHVNSGQTGRIGHQSASLRLALLAEQEVIQPRRRVLRLPREVAVRGRCLDMGPPKGA